MINKIKHMAWGKDNADRTLSYRLPAKPPFLILIIIIGIISTAFGAFTPQEVAADTAGEQRRRIEELENRLQQQEKQLKDTREQLEAMKKSMDAQQQKEEQAKAKIKTPTKEVIKEILGTITMDYREATPEEKRLETIYDDGFYLRGMDDTIKIGGWYQFDGRLYLDEGYPLADTFTNRRARLDVRGVLENDWGYRLYANLLGSPVIKEAWLEYQHFPFARLKLGQFKEPFSLESQYSSRWIDFVERSMGVTALQPGEDIGVMVFGNFWDSRVVYGIGAFNGQGIDEDAVVDDKDVTGRVAVQPFRQQKDSLFEKLYIGGSFGFGNNELKLGNKHFVTAGQLPFYEFASDAEADGKIYRYDAEIEWLNGPFDLTTEFIGTHYDRIRAGVEEDALTVNSWYLTLSYVLTGEDAQRNKPIEPHRNFDFKGGGWGALQVLGRFERFWTNDDLLDNGMAFGSDGAYGYSLGLNWWPNIHLKFMLNYVYTDFDQTITMSGEELNDENVILSRAQFNF